MRRLIAFLQTAAILSLLVGCGSSDKSSPTQSQLHGVTNLRATLANSSTITLTWTDNSDAEAGFKVKRFDPNANNWAIHAILPANAVTYADSGLAEFTTFRYCVFAYKGASLSYTSDTVQAATSLRSPDGLVATMLSASRIELVWNDQSAVESGYKVERKVGAGRFARVALPAANSTSLIDTGLAANTAYTYRVAALKDAVISAFSNEASARTNFLPPVSPSNLTTTTFGTSNIRLIWRDNSLDEQGFRVERTFTDGDGGWTQIAALGANTALFSDTGLTEGTVCRYRVYAYIEAENSLYAGPTVGRTNPAAPLDLTAARESETSISIRWRDGSASETGYAIERKLQGGGFQPVGTIAANTLTYLDEGLSSNMTYVYHVRALKDDLTSEWSNEASARTNLLTPEPPSDLSARSNADAPNSARLMWLDNSDNESGFIVETSQERVNGWRALDTTSADVTSFSIGNLQTESTWFFRVSAMNQHGNSALSNVATCVIVGIPPAPTNLTAVSDNRTPAAAALAWQDHSLAEDGFIVEMSRTGVDSWTVYDTLGANVASLIVRNLTEEETYYFRLLAYNEVGRSDYTNIASATIVGLPRAPTVLTAEAPTFYAALLNWTDNSNAERGFHLERREIQSFSYARVAALGPNVTSYNDSTVNHATTYVYRVKSYNDFGSSVYSNEATVQIPRRPPLAPSGLRLEVLDIDQIQVTWDDNAFDEDGYFLERRDEGQNNFNLVTVTDPNVSAYLDEGLTPESWYSYRVRCRNPVGYSSYSNADSAQTQSLTYFEEGFEGMAADQPPTGWTMNVAGSSWARVTTTEPHEGSKSLQFHDPDSGANHAMSYTSHRGLTRGIVTAWLFIPDNSWFGFFGANPAFQTYSFRFFFMSNDSFAVLNAGAMVSTGTYPTDRWFKVDVVWRGDSSFYQVLFDDQLVADQCGAAVTETGYVAGVAFSDRTVSNAFMDDFRVVRYWDDGERSPRFRPRDVGPVRLYTPMRISEPTKAGVPRQR